MTISDETYAAAHRLASAALIHKSTPTYSDAIMVYGRMVGDEPVDFPLTASDILTVTSAIIEAHDNSDDLERIVEAGEETTAFIITAVYPEGYPTTTVAHTSEAAVATIAAHLRPYTMTDTPDEDATEDALWAVEKCVEDTPAAVAMQRRHVRLLITRSRVREV